MLSHFQQQKTTSLPSARAIILISGNAAPISEQIAEELLAEHILAYCPSADIELDENFDVEIERSSTDGQARFTAELSTLSKFEAWKAALLVFCERLQQELLLDAETDQFDLVEYNDARFFSLQGIDKEPAYGTNLSDSEFFSELQRITPSFVREIAQKRLGGENIEFHWSEI